MQLARFLTEIHHFHHLQFLTDAGAYIIMYITIASSAIQWNLQPVSYYNWYIQSEQTISGLLEYHKILWKWIFRIKSLSYNVSTIWNIWNHQVLGGWIVTWQATALDYTLRNYFYNDMDPLHPMSFWHLVARLDVDIYPQNKCYGTAVWIKLPSPVWTNSI